MANALSPCGIKPVVRPRAETYSTTFHQWLISGVFSMRTLPTTCVISCSVSRVSTHSATGISGHPEAESDMCTSYWVAGPALQRPSRPSAHIAHCDQMLRYRLVVDELFDRLLDQQILTGQPRVVLVQMLAPRSDDERLHECVLALDAAVQPPPRRTGALSRAAHRGDRRQERRLVLRLDTVGRNHQHRAVERLRLERERRLRPVRRRPQIQVAGAG